MFYINICYAYSQLFHNLIKLYQVYVTYGIVLFRINIEKNKKMFNTITKETVIFFKYNKYIYVYQF